MPNEIALVKEETLEALDLAAENGLLAGNIKSQFKKTFALAQAVGQLKGLLTKEVMSPIMQLQDNSLGFRTDKKDKGGYPMEVVRDCLIEATIQGVSVVGNEFNIIAGNCYITKQGLGHKLSEIPNLRHSITPGIPVMKNGGAIIEMEIEWSYVRQKGEKKLSICVRVNKMMGTDAIIGKATRKARAWLFQHITGQEIPEGEVEATTMKDVTPTSSPFESKAEVKETVDVKSEEVKPSKIPEKTEAPAVPEWEELLIKSNAPATVAQVKKFMEVTKIKLTDEEIKQDLKSVVSGTLDWLATQEEF